VQHLHKWEGAKMRREKKLNIRRSYETNRLANTYLQEAYEKLFPTIKHEIKNKDKNEKPILEKELKRIFK